MRAAFRWFAVGHGGLAVCGAICGQINWLENVRPPYNTSSVIHIYSELTLTNAVPCLCLNEMQNEARPHHRGRERWKQFGAWAHLEPKKAIWLVSNSCWRSTVQRFPNILYWPFWNHFHKWQLCLTAANSGRWLVHWSSENIKIQFLCLCF